MAAKEAIWEKLRGMDWFRGLRAGTAISAPVLLGHFLNQPEMAWAALGGFEAIISDRGGPYRSRISNLGLLTVGGAAGCLLGTLVGGSVYTALPATVIWCFIWSYLIVLGQPFSSAGPLIQLIFLCGLGVPNPSFSVASSHALYLIGGGVWAMALSLFLWPVDPYRPARMAVSDCYHGLAAFLGSIHELDLRKQHRPALWHRLARHQQSRLRRLLETGRHAVASVRMQSAAETLRGRNLVILLESADLLMARTVALCEHMEMTAKQNASPCVERGKLALLLLEEVEQWIADLLRRRFKELEETTRRMQARLQRIPAEMAHCLTPEDAQGHFMLHQITDIAQNLDAALESATAVRVGRETRRGRPERAHRWAPLRHEVDRLQQLIANFTLESLMLRHAARVAVVCGIDIWILKHFKIDHGYWLPLTSLIVLQPHVSGTFRRSLQRIGGTVGGGILAAVLAVYLRSQLGTAAALFLLAFLTLAVLPLSYSMFCFFLTPTFVLAFLPYVGDWQIAAVRILNTVLGAVIAMLAMATLWPSMEHGRFGKQLQRSLEANRAYLNALRARWTEVDRVPGEGHRSLSLARRGTGLAHNDSEESLDRLILEQPWASRLANKTSTRATEAAIAFVTYLRRFGSSITTLASFPGDFQWKHSPEVQGRLAALDAQLIALTAAIGGQPVEWSQFASTESDSSGTPNASSYNPRHNGQRQLARLERQLGVLRKLFLAMRRGGLLGAPAADTAIETEANEPAEITHP